ncbi:MULTISPECIES: glycosyltransferase family 4 protein [unclassified Brevundimonas]|uniref:glycosyltransferase family 4 protein n=1 Tax=unclassified Brevundimonas TaxID=2622653 RepID=UPI0025C665F5|nr:MULTISPECIES: glycosyltransferase family 4 protein [unclassified Brevundimonas]
MKILIISNLYPPNVVGGYERLAFSVAEALAARGHDIHVLTSSYGGQVADYPGQSIQRSLRILADDHNIYHTPELSADERRRSNEHNVERFLSEISRIKPDVLFVWNLYFFDGSLIEAIEKCGVPASLFLTDNWLAVAQTPDRVGNYFENYVHGQKSFDTSVDLSGGDLRTIGASAIMGSDFIRTFYAACGYRFQSEATVHNGVAMGPETITPLRDRSALYSPGTLRILFAGRIVDIKGPEYCVRALKQVRTALGDEMQVELLIVGDVQDAPFFSRFEQLIASDTSGARIRIVPPVSEQDLPELWNTHDIYIFPSLYEPFSLTLILALAAGIPTVASDVCGNVEIVYHDRTGLTFRSRDEDDLAGKIVRLARDGKLRNRLSRRARTLARKFTFKRMIDQIEIALKRSDDPQS